MRRRAKDRFRLVCIGVGTAAVFGIVISAFLADGTVRPRGTDHPLDTAAAVSGGGENPLLAHGSYSPIRGVYVTVSEEPSFMMFVRGQCKVFPKEWLDIHGGREFRRLFAQGATIMDEGVKQVSDAMIADRMADPLIWREIDCVNAQGYYYPVSPALHDILLQNPSPPSRVVNVASLKQPVSAAKAQRMFEEAREFCNERAERAMSRDERYRRLDKLRRMADPAKFIIRDTCMFGAGRTSRAN